MLSFAAGDMVALKSGSPLMTVSVLTPPKGGLVDCWYYCHVDGLLKELSLDPALLVGPLTAKFAYTFEGTHVAPLPGTIK